MVGKEEGARRTRHVEAVQKLVYLRQRLQVRALVGAQLVHAPGDHGHHVVVALNELKRKESKSKM